MYSNPANSVFDATLLDVVASEKNAYEFFFSHTGNKVAGDSLTSVAWSQDDQRIAYTTSQKNSYSGNKLFSTSSSMMDMIDLGQIRNECDGVMAYLAEYHTCKHKPPLAGFLFMIFSASGFQK